jgi:hypothetical protein
MTLTVRLVGAQAVLRAICMLIQHGAAFMARHEGRLGTLFISARGIRFAALNTGKLKKGVHDEGDIDLASDTATLTSLPASDIKIAMEDIVGICKTDRKAVKLKVISGLSFQTADGTVRSAQVNRPACSS